MRIILTKSVLVGDAEVIPTPKGTVIDMDDSMAKEFIAHGLADQVEVKKASEPMNKKAPEPKNKSA